MQETGEAFKMPFPTVPIPTPSIDVQRAIVKAAHKHGRLALAHAVSMQDTLRMLEAGVDGLAHACTETLSKELVYAYVKNNAFVIPTLTVTASATGDEQNSRERFASGLVDGEKARMCSCLNISREGFSLQNAIETVKALKDAGIDIVW